MSREQRDRLVALAHAIEPLMMLAVDAEQVLSAGDRTVDGLLRMRLQLTRFQVWLQELTQGGNQ